MLNSYTNKVYDFNSDLYDNDTVRASVNCIATHFSKMAPQHRLKGKPVNSQINRLLYNRPNPDMSTFDFLYKTITALYMQNNVYIYIKRDNLGNIIALYPVLYNQAELKQDKYNNLFLDFQFSNGQRAVESIDNLIILRRHFYKNDFFGESNKVALFPVINLLHIINQSIINAVKTSGIVRGILKATGMLQENDRKAKKEAFEKDYLSISEGSGVIVTDSSFDYTALNSTNTTVIDDKVTTLAKDKIYTYFGISEKIVNGEFSDDDYNAFYESVLEPLAIYFSQEITAKVFTQREMDFGNEIVFVADRLSYMSTKSKVDMFTAIKELGVISKGQIATIFNLPVPPDADRYLESLNYMDSSKITEYQLTKANTELGDKDGE